jgi:hypothetical protein
MLIKVIREGPYPQLFCVLFVSLWPFFMIMNGDRVDAMDSSRDGGMRCNRLLRLCILCFWFVLTQWGAN